MAKNFNRLLGQALKRQRKLRKISQTALGAALGMHQTAVCRMERGEQQLTAVQMILAASVFDMSLDELLELARNEGKRKI